MQADVLVAAFADSPHLRETLAVLLESECRLRFLGSDTPPAPGSAPADLAVVAAARPEALLRRIASDWPAVPIVNIDLPGASPTRPTGGGDLTQVRHVPLQPEAIRAAVLPHLQPDADRILRVELLRIGTSLRAEIAGALASLGVLSRRWAGENAASSGPAPPWDAPVDVLVHAVAQLEEFRGRPRNPGTSREFVSALGRALSAGEPGGSESRLRCEVVVQSRVPGPPGPVALVPVLSRLLRAHVQGCSVSPVVSVFEMQAGLSVRYPARRAMAQTSWPLLLASLALRACGWKVDLLQESGSELLDLRPQGAAD